MVGVGPKFNATLVESASFITPIVTNAYDDALADKIIEDVCLDADKVTAGPPRPGLGCDVDVLFIFDFSERVPTQLFHNVSVLDIYLYEELDFATNELASNWNIYPFATEVGFGVGHGSMGFVETKSFTYAGFNDLMKNVEWYRTTDKPWGSISVTYLLTMVQRGLTDHRRTYPVAIVVFLYDASVSNVEEAVPYAQSLVANGNRLIIVTPTEANVKLFSKLTNETFYIANFDSNDAVQVSVLGCLSMKLAVRFC
ncbi:unnamed protein product [Toxocara canis]|uniref:VWFA domain-containing protein n=1 Tax=Toxocara canis TaxID=6265 RepID=A0A183U1R8_TOXCA|nr:unnamed protein product [Toxocara canis]